MCRGQKTCTELETDIKLWNHETPLLPPIWFNDELEKFITAFVCAVNGDISKSIEILGTIKSDELRNWYCEHGQISGTFRKKVLKIDTQKPNNLILDTLRAPDKYANEVFMRDTYTCQYCNMRVLPKEIFAIYSKIVGAHIFQATGTNNERHGIVLAFRANADHVIPWTHGGQTDPSNLVSCCWSCNYGKAGYTLDEIGLRNPFEKKQTNTDWKGLTEYLL